MKSLKLLLLLLTTLTSALTASAETSYDIAKIYSVIKPESGTKAVDRLDRTIEAEYILVPTKVDTGKYIVEVKKIGDNLYLVKNSDLCIETKYCREWTSFYKEVVLIIDTNYGYTKGKVIFD